MVAAVPASVEENVSVVRATAPKFFKDFSETALRNRIWLAALRKRGNVKYNSHTIVRQIRKSEPDVRQYVDGQTRQFSQHDAFEQLSFDVRGYDATDSLTVKQALMNSGESQLINLYKIKSKDLFDSITRKLYAELYVDGYAAGNGNRYIGLRSCLGTGTTVAADKVAQPSDTYGGISTAVGQGGSWSSGLTASPNAAIGTDWPFGSGTVAYDYNSPVVVNWSSTSWGTNSTAWEDNCEAAIRFAVDAQTNRGALSADAKTPYMGLFAVNLFSDVKNFYSARNRQVVPHKYGENLGFDNTLNFEGVMLTHEFDVPANQGYIICPEHIELFSMFDTLISPDGPEHSIERDAYLYAAKVLGNMTFDAKYVTQLRNVA